MTIDELFNLAQSRAAENVQFVIDENLRIISVPQTAAVFGVEYDKDVNTVGFMINRYYSEVDLSEFAIRVSFENANNEMDFFDATDIVADESTVTFSWTMGASAFKYQGTIHFAVNFIKADADGTVQQAYNTTIAEGQCLVGLNVNSADVPESDYSDLIIHIQQQIQLAGNTAVLQVCSEGTAQTTAVTNAGTAQVQAVNSAGTTQVQAVNDAAEQALGNISAAAPALPAVSAAAAWQSVTVKPDGTGYNLASMAPIEATIRPTVTGNPAVCEDSAAWGLQGLKIYGKSTQDGEPSPENPVPIVSAGDGGSIAINLTSENLFDTTSMPVEQSIKGVTIKRLDDGGISLTGNPTSRFAIYPLENATLPEGYYRIKGTYSNVRVDHQSGRPNYWSNITFQLKAGDKISLYFILDPEDYSPQIIYPILSFGTDFITFKKPEKWEILDFSTPNGLPGIPVESGGTFTDADGQQLVCDVKDYGTGKYTQNCVKVVFDGSDDESWLKMDLSGTAPENSYRYDIGLNNTKLYSDTELPVALCNAFAATTASIGYEGNTVGFTIKSDRLNVYLKNIASVTDLKAWLATNPLEVIYQLATPIETDIPAEEMAAYRALTTYGGATVVSTAEPVAGIEARYVMDGTAAYTKITAALAQLSAANTQTSQTVNTMLGASE